MPKNSSNKRVTQSRRSPISLWGFWALLFFCSETVFAKTATQVRLGVHSGVDSNARRDFLQSGLPTQADALVSGVGSVVFQWQMPRFLTSASYDVGARKFLFLSTEDTLIQAAFFETAYSLFRPLDVGVTARGKDRRGAERDYTDLAARAFLAFRPDDKVLLRFEAGGHRFLFYPRMTYSFGAPEFAFSARYRFDARHSMNAFFDNGTRTYDSMAQPSPINIDQLAQRSRVDQAMNAGVGYQFRGPFLASVQYVYSEVVSNSYGETVLRHRLNASVGLRMPFKSSLLASGNLQWTRLPDGIFISQELNILEDDESHNSASLKWAKALNSSFDIELKYAVFQNQLPQNQLQYVRHLGMAGLVYRY